MIALRPRPGALAPMVAVICAVAIALGTHLVAALPITDPEGIEESLLAQGVAGGEGFPVGDPAVELARVRADVTFWAARLEAAPMDVVAAVRLADASLAEARLTGDVGAYDRALTAADSALALAPGHAPAEAAKALTLVALHRFAEARDLARSMLARDGRDATALGVLGDASLELGDLAAAETAYRRLGLTADDASVRVREGRLAFIRGDIAAAIAAARDGVSAAIDEGLEGDALAFHHSTLGETLLATGEATAARESFETALAARPGHPAALVGLARLDAFEGDDGGAIAGLAAALEALPAPEWLALRADLLDRRGRPGDAAAAAADRATIDVITTLAAAAGPVHDRGLARILADTGRDPDRAVQLARAELAVRRDVYGYDALAWALVNAGDARAADAAMRSALAEGTPDARLWYHAGVIAATLGRDDLARGYLSDALALGAALDPRARERASAVLESLR